MPARTRKNTCTDLSHIPKYANRQSPPADADQTGCRGKLAEGNDGSMYKSTRKRDGTYAWRKVAGKAIKTRSSAGRKKKRSSRSGKVVIIKHGDESSSSDSDSDYYSDEQVVRLVPPKIKATIELGGVRTATLAERRRAAALSLLSLREDEFFDDPELLGNEYEAEILARGALRSGSYPYATALALARRRNINALIGRAPNGDIL